MQTLAYPRNTVGIIAAPPLVISKPSKTKRVLLTDDDPLVRDAVSILLSQQKGFEIVGEASNGEEAIALASRLKPDLLVLDVNMPRKAGLEALRDLAEGLPHSNPTMRTIMLTVSMEKKAILQALQLGARGIVLKEAARAVLVEAAEAVLKGEYWIDRRRVSNIAAIISELQESSSTQQPAASGLTPRELQIVRFIVEGRTNKDIATTLKTSEQVIKNHLGRIFDKLGVFNRLELALYALDHGLSQRP